MRAILPGLTRHNVGNEVLAGITLLAIALPLNLGYAQIAGLPPSSGLYALILPSVVFALLASSRFLVASPDPAVAALVGSTLAGLAPAGSHQYVVMAAAQALVGGLLFALCAVFRLGFLADFLSRPILVGFIGGLGTDVLLNQTAKMAGAKLPNGPFFERLVALVNGIDALHWWSLGLSAATIGILVPARRWMPRVPWSLIVLAAAIASSALLHLPAKGVAVLGAIPPGFPVLSVPDLTWHQWLSLIAPALAITTVTLAQGLLLARSYAEKYGDSTAPNQDLFAFAGANIASGLSSGFTIGSSPARAAAMDHAGSRTQLPLLVMASGALALLVFGTDLLASIPSPAIGAIVAVAVVKLIDVGEMRRLWRFSRFEFLIAITCYVGVLLVGPLAGLIVAFVLSLINLLRKAARPAVDVLQGSDDPHLSLTVSKNPSGETVPGVIVMRFAAPIFFGNCAALSTAIRTAVRDAPNPVCAFVLDMEAVTDVDITGAEALTKEQQWLRDNGIVFAYGRVRPQLHANLKRMNLLEGYRVFETNRAAVAALRPTGGAAAAL